MAYRLVTLLWGPDSFFVPAATIERVYNFRPSELADRRRLERSPASLTDG